ncbi:MAG TPA: hypothetical protein VGA21_00970 [Cyclobacteriaceae bacterium]|jgi:Tol biopolymer transport system component
MKSAFLLFPLFIVCQSLAQSKVDSHDPVWSPDGNQIAFYSNRDGDFEIYVVNSDGSNLRQITSNEFNDGSPTCSPDGKKLLFKSNRAGNSNFYLHELASGKTHLLHKILRSWFKFHPILIFRCGNYWVPDLSNRFSPILFLNHKPKFDEGSLLTISC